MDIRVDRRESLVAPSGPHTGGRRAYPWLRRGERRRQVRRPWAAGVAGFLGPAGVPLDAGPRVAWPARVVDLTAAGVGLVAPGLVRPGVGVLVELVHAGGALRLLASAWVVHAAPTTGGGYRLGCVFARPLTAGQFEAVT